LNLKDVKVLTKEETEKAVRIERANRSLIESPFITMYKPIDIIGRYYLGLQKADGWLLSSDFALSLNLLTNLEIFKNIEISFNIQLNS